uniref:Uncharacterized protein n=1 Tax=Rhizophora mucronata TaxID=61149 RepID=A0A2P2PK42_RHIMU
MLVISAQPVLTFQQSYLLESCLVSPSCPQAHHHPQP